ncbi:MAG: tRNA (adenosine(37)-N6)-dimethylallyltransferase MiaA [Clostridiales bacterium]|nr:tRNA (adenosine(37)-N6)-dimethylallyltransferase MiaA [Clostridiales bacterium]
MRPRIIAITGATASGKSALAMQLAQQLGGEIVCMDSMQIYRGMDIGTAKPTPAERQTVPHHMLDVVPPDAPYTVADYAEAASAVIRGILSRGKLPLLVGGTGLYLKALMHGLSLGVSRSDPAIRARLEAIADQPGGKQQLHRMLSQVDEASAKKLHPNDLRRVIRAIEVYELTGTPLSQTRQEEAGEFTVLPLAIRMEREQLFARIEMRVDQMLEMGLFSEVKSLLEAGVSPEAQAMQGIGYKEMVPAVQGILPVEEARRQIILNTRHYAKRQETWFKGEPATCWLAAENALPLAGEAIAAFLADTQHQAKE